jgi:hypothetical protein
MRIAAVLILGLSLTGCFRTHYANFSPLNPDRAGAAAAAAPVRSTSGWQHFFLFGWVPSKLTIDAKQECGSPEHVDSIDTRQTFLEGLVESVAGFYINVYAPWDAVVHCSADPGGGTARAEVQTQTAR